MDADYFNACAWRFYFGISPNSPLRISMISDLSILLSPLSWLWIWLFAGTEGSRPQLGAVATIVAAEPQRVASSNYLRNQRNLWINLAVDQSFCGSRVAVNLQLTQRGWELSWSADFADGRGLF
jgi:hypothetical protein